MIDAIKKFLKKDPQVHKFLAASKKALYTRVRGFVPDAIFVKWQYEKATKKKLDLRNPRTFNEKLQWLKVYWRDPVCTVCADKYAVREYVKRLLGEEVLTRLYAVYDRVEDVDLSVLPDSFVMKVTHGSGQNIFCRSKREVDWAKAFRELKTYLGQNYYDFAREWVYKDIVPHVVCEELLNEDGQSPKDFKFWCFNGVPEFVSVHFSRYADHRVNYYDMNWQQLDMVRRPQPHMTEHVMERPENLDTMVEYARKLSARFPFVRVDLYNVNGRVYFGEMTFFPCYGVVLFDPGKYEDYYGSLLKLPAKTRGELWGTRQPVLFDFFGPEDGIQRSV